MKETKYTVKYTTSFKKDYKRVKRLIPEHLAFSGGLGSLIQKKRFDDLIGHLHKNVLFAKWIILFEIDGLHRHALTLFEKGHHSSGAYSADPDGWKR